MPERAREHGCSFRMESTAYSDFADRVAAASIKALWRCEETGRYENMMKIPFDVAVSLFATDPTKKSRKVSELLHFDVAPLSWWKGEDDQLREAQDFFANSSVTSIHPGTASMNIVDWLAAQF